MYLVTGGGGFIGSHLVRALVRRGERVRVLDNGFSGSSARVADVLCDVEWIDGDIRDAETVRRACQGAEVVLHHAAIASPFRSIAEPRMAHDVNVTGTLNVLIAAHEQGVRRVVVASSAAVYGNLPTSPKSESLLARPVSPYGVHKLTAESYCPVWHSIYGLETVALRYFNVFGPSQDPKSEYAAVIPRFITTVLAGQTPVVYGDGEQSRDFIYVGNVVDVNLRAAVAPAAPGTIMNVGTGTKITLNRLLREISRIVGKDIAAVYEPERPGDIRESVADISLLRSVLSYEPAVTFGEGIEHTLSAYQSGTVAV